MTLFALLIVRGMKGKKKEKRKKERKKEEKGKRKRGGPRAKIDGLELARLYVSYRRDRERERERERDRQTEKKQ